MINGDTLFLGASYDDPDVTPADKLRYDACLTVADSVIGEGAIGVMDLVGGNLRPDFECLKMSAAVTEKRNSFKELKAEYCQPKTPKLVEASRGSYLAMDGQGAPGGNAYQACLEALYGMAYTIKFARKAEGADFVVCKLEGLYAIGMPLDKFAALLKKGKNGDFDAVRLEEIEEGQCVQMLHVGKGKNDFATAGAITMEAAITIKKGAHLTADSRK